MTQHLLRLWFASDLVLLHKRRERRMLIMTSLTMIVMGMLWGTIFLWQGHWILVGMDLVLIGSGLAVLTLLTRGQVRYANVLLFSILSVLVGTIALVFDAPTISAPRSTHLYLLPLGLAALIAFREEPLWIRHAIAMLCIGAFITLASSTAMLFPGYNLDDTLRVPGTWVQTLAATTLLFLLFHIVQTDATERTTLEGELLQALAQQQFRMHFQPQVNAGGLVVGAEVLLRWQHPRRGLIGPAYFIGAAETNGLILPIGQWVLEQACAQLQAWSQDAVLRTLALAVNVSQRQFRQPDFVERTLDAIQRHRIHADQLELELTETMLMEDIEAVREKMLLLCSRGLSFSLDDFGTGYSSLSYLKRLPLHKLKIDRSFVSDVPEDSHSASIVRWVVSLGQSLGLSVIAEGVETTEQRTFLQQNGCVLYQGYLFRPALPLEEFEAYVRHANGPT
ncbi:putative bifunctional diguanylate cyclase/phosphodiesterase [Candidatus Symbiobacter mobilis]|uniref:EAL domain protein n=1 Tax=Candidatus Symbiobacter mobilis CR TaxID=946483 RepID=U5N5L5_9BURK|nr:EAL domain-containing protein [Candidatus Symbiobacter mobilis]AGX86555.1 EAL domain protein [Candidatus Symbiobacter mobilis CR]